MKHISILVFSYLLGGIPFGLLVSKWWSRLDVRKHGSGNIGMTNVLRTAGYIPALLTLLGDAGKGAAAVLLMSKIGDPSLSFLAGTCAVVGHNWPPFLRFKGGKGVATAAGAVLAFRPWALIILIAIWGLVLAINRYVSLASIVVAVCVPVVLVFFGISRSETILAVFLAAITVWRHRTNIRRLMQGTEFRIGEKAE